MLTRTSRSPTNPGLMPVPWTEVPAVARLGQSLDECGPVGGRVEEERGGDHVPSTGQELADLVEVGDTRGVANGVDLAGQGDGGVGGGADPGRRQAAQVPGVHSVLFRRVHNYADQVEVRVLEDPPQRLAPDRPGRPLHDLQPHGSPVAVVGPLAALGLRPPIARDGTPAPVRPGAPRLFRQDGEH